MNNMHSAPADEFYVANLFADGMIVPRDKPIVIWGRAPLSQNGRTVSAEFRGLRGSGVIDDGSFRFSLDGTLPAKPWQNILAARDFGWLVSECGSGWMWTKNAREGRINPPPLTPESSAGSERLWVEGPRGRVSLFAAEDGVGE